MNRVWHVVLAGIIAVGLAAPAFAQQQASQTASTPPLVQLLQSKGILTSDEAAMISQASSADEANARLAQLLYSKGVISKQDYEQMLVPSLVQTGAAIGQPHLVNAVIHVEPKAPPTIGPGSDLGTEPGFRYGDVPAETGVIPAVAPVRVLPIDIPKQGGLIPDIKLGSGANMKVYGFFKMSAIEDRASSGGATFGSNDFPLPMLLGDTGPTSDPQFHIKSRSFRIGSQFEWVPKGSDLVVTGRIETDYEGDYTNVNNRNISGVRSSQLSLRLAYVRLDTKVADTPVFAEFGQDWTLLGSSTLPNLFETTGLMVGLGNLYERAPQMKVGVQFGHGDFKFEPEFAIQLPTSSDPGLSDEQRARFGDRAGADSNQPAVEGRLVFQFPLNHNWVGVAPAQIIVSGHHATINEIYPRTAQTTAAGTATGTASGQDPLAPPPPPPTPVTVTLNNPVSNGAFGLPTTIISGATCPGGTTVGVSIAECYPTGVQVSYPQNIFTVEAQLPTPWVTAVAKWYKGADLRFFFGGQVNTVFISPGPGLITAGTATSFSGQALPFGCPSGAANIPATTCAGPITVGQLNPIRGQGGFAQLSFPLSRIFHADPEGHNSGWVFQVLYGTDMAKRSDVVQTGGNSLVRTNTGIATLSYKLNKWVSFVNEVTYYQTNTGWHVVDEEAVKVPKLFMGTDHTAAHDWRNEFGTIVTF